MINNNNLQHISNGLDEILTNMLTRCMLNPKNKDFYIGNLTLDKVKQYFVEMPQDDVSVASVFWNAYSRAEGQYLKEQAELKALTDTYHNDCISAHELEKLYYLENKYNTTHMCPECGNNIGYVPGVRCPNCDYEGED